MRILEAVAAFAAFLLLAGPVSAQEQDDRPVLRAGNLPSDLVLDGLLDEPAWREAEAVRNLTMVDPFEGGEPSEPTTVQVLADAGAVVIGVRCRDSRPEEIVSRTMERDAVMEGEDRIVVLLDTFLDERTGYVFTVNPAGARRDSLVSRRGEREDASWDGLWEAKTARGPDGWSVEILIPILTLSFREDLDTWGFNVERHLKRTTAPGVSVPPGTYHGYRYHPHLRTADKRWWSAEVRYDLGEHYDGRLTSLIGDFALNPHPLVTVSGQGERHVGHLPGGNFRRELVSARLRLNLSPDFNLSTFVQFDTDSHDLGSFARVRWQVTPESELFLVYRQNWQELGGDLDSETYEGTLKVQ